MCFSGYGWTKPIASASFGASRNTESIFSIGRHGTAVPKLLSRQYDSRVLYCLDSKTVDDSRG